MLALSACLLAAPHPREQGLIPITQQEQQRAAEHSEDPDTNKGKMPSAGHHDGGPDPHSRDWYPHGKVREFCKGNIVDRSLAVCCQKACGQCGGDDCANRAPGAKECCHEDIMHGRGDNICETEDQSSCVMPLTCEEDQCLPMCPLHPACSIIWFRRGMNYTDVRKLNVRTLNVYGGMAAVQRSSRAPERDP